MNPSIFSAPARLGLLAVVAVWAVLAHPAAVRAADGVVTPAGPLTPAALPITLAAAEADAPEAASPALRMHAGPEDADEWHAPWLTGNKLHEYLGIGSLVAAGLAAVTPPESENGGGSGEGEGGFHHFAGVTAAALGGAAVGTGLVFHWDDIRLRNGIGDPDNLHALLGLLGATAYLVAVSNAPAGGHAAAGIAGAASMLVAIKLTW